MSTRLAHPLHYRIVRQHFTDGAALSNFSYQFTDNNLRDLVSLSWLMTRDAVVVTPFVGLLISSGLGVYSYHHWGETLFPIGDPVAFDAFQATSYTGRAASYGSIIFPLPTPCFILPNDILSIQSDVAPGHCTFTDISATFKLWQME